MSGKKVKRLWKKDLIVLLISMKKRLRRNGHDLKIQKQMVNQNGKNGNIIKLLRSVMLRRKSIQKRGIESEKDWKDKIKKKLFHSRKDNQA